MKKSEAWIAPHLSFEHGRAGVVNDGPLALIDAPA